MALSKLETEDHSRDAAFNKAMHKDSSKAEGGFRAMMKKDKTAQKAAVDEYFKHWDNKAAKDETDADREVVLLFQINIQSQNLTSVPRHEELNTLLSQDSTFPLLLSAVSVCCKQC
jgi:sterol 24-C-methyltransferase